MNISIRELALQLASLARRVDALARTRPQLAHSSIEDGVIEEYDRDGNLVSRIGTQPDGSHGVVVLDGPQPLRTSAPTCTATALSIAVTWDGNFIDPDTGVVDAELAAYDDFKYVEVHVGDVVSFVPSTDTLSGYINSREGGTVGVPSEAGEKYVKFVTRSLAGKTSVPSVGTPVDVPPLVDAGQFDLALLDIQEAQANLATAQQTLNTAFPNGAFDVENMPVDVQQLIAAEGAVINEAVINSMAVQMASIIEADIGNLRAVNATMDTLVAQAIAGQTAEFISITAEQISGGTINAALDIAAGGRLTVGNVTQPHVIIGNGKIEALLPNTEGAAIPTVTVGGMEDAFRVVDIDGNFLGGITPDGHVTGTSVDAEFLRVGGSDLGEILSPLSQGVMVFTGPVSGRYGPYTAKTGVWEFGFDAIGGRRYEINIMAEYRATSHPAAITGVNKVHTALGGNPPAPLVSSPQEGHSRNFDTAGSFRAHSVTWTFNPTNDETTRWLWWIQPISGSTVEMRNFELTVVDLGITPNNRGRASLGGASGTTPTPTPPTQDYTKTWTFTDHHIWTQFSKGDSHRPAWVRSGTDSSFSSGAIYRTYLPLPSGALSALSAASSVAKVEIRLSQVAGYGSGGPTVSTFTATSFTNEPSVANTASVGSIKYGETKWITLSSAQRNALAAGAKGIAIGLRTAVPNQDFYGPSASSSLRPQIRISYTA